MSLWPPILPFGPNLGPSVQWQNSSLSHVPPNMCAKCWVSSMIEPPHHQQWVGGHCGFLTGDMEDMSHPWHLICSSYTIPNYCAKFQLFSIIRSASRTTRQYLYFLVKIRLGYLKYHGNKDVTHKQSVTTQIYIRLHWPHLKTSTCGLHVH